MASSRQNPYVRFRERTLTLNDYLAIDRTVLANERTLLSYIRTTLTQLIIGGSALKFFDSTLFTVIGGLFFAGAVTTLVIGTRRYRKTDQLLRAALEAKTGDEEHPLQENVARKREEQQGRKDEKTSAETPPAPDDKSG